MSKDTIIALHAEHQGRWKNREEIAERMIALIGQLYREKNIVVSVYGRSLINRSVIQILKTHRRTRVVDVELSVVNTFPILEALAKVENIGSAEVDIGKLAVEYKEKGGDVDAFVAQAVESIKGSATSEQPKDVVLYGFGRIGRILARLIISQSGLGRGLSLKAIVVRSLLTVTWLNVLLYFVVILFTVLLQVQFLLMKKTKQLSLTVTSLK